MNEKVSSFTVKNQITQNQNQKENNIKSITNYFRSENMLKQFQSALGSKEWAERFIRIILTSIQTTPELQLCTLGSIVNASLISAQLHLEPNTPLGHAYILPYFNSKKKQYYAQFQLGYKGIIDLFYRHPLAKVIYAKEVRSLDEFKIYEGNRMEIYHRYDHKVPKEKRGDVIGYYAIAELVNGARNIAICIFKTFFRTQEISLRHLTKNNPLEKISRPNVYENCCERMSQVYAFVNKLREAISSIIR
jgi:recombination protein RecT